jgi:hypothetical protein
MIAIIFYQMNYTSNPQPHLLYFRLKIEKKKFFSITHSWPLPPAEHDNAMPPSPDYLQLQHAQLRKKFVGFRSFIYVRFTTRILEKLIGRKQPLLHIMDQTSISFIAIDKAKALTSLEMQNHELNQSSLETKWSS